MEAEQPRERRALHQTSWFEKVMALVILMNLILVVFDLTYIPLRDLYLRKLPEVPALYDGVKAIQPQRDTQQYLDTVDRLKRRLAKTEFSDPQVKTLLESLSNQSIALIDENAFAIASKVGTLEKIKNRMREHLKQDGAKQAFQVFWSQDYLTEVGWPQALGFFDQEIRPLMATNYFRPIGETGQFVDYFWQIDRFFIGLFGLEFLIRTFYLSRRYSGTSWLDAMLWRWYDLLLLLPFWRWLRVIPAMSRLYQARLLNLNRARVLISRWLAENIAGEVTELVVVRTLSLTQESIKQGGLLRWLLQPKSYVEVNKTNEIEAITARLCQLAVYKVYPQIQPDLEALLRHTIAQMLNQSPIYRGLQTIPGVGHIPTDLATQLATHLSQAIHDGLTHSLEDAEAATIFRHLSAQFSQTLRSELQDKQTLQEIQLLLADLLEELKLTYLRRSGEEDVDHTLAEVYQLRTSTGHHASLEAPQP